MNAIFLSGRLLQRLLIVLVSLLSLFIAACGGTSAPPTFAAQQLLPTAKSVQGNGQFVVTALKNLGEKRISRTVFEYTFAASIQNTGPAAATSVNAKLLTVPLGTEIIDGTMAAGTIPAGATVTPSDVIVLRQDRTLPFSVEALVWDMKASATAITTTTPAASAQLSNLKPAEVYVFSLSDLGIPADATGVSVTGGVTDALIKERSLRFSTAGDNGAQQAALFKVTAGATPLDLHANIRSLRPQEVITHIEAAEDGSTLPVPTLLISGFGVNNAFIGNTLKFKPATATSLDLKDDSEGLIMAADNVKISLKKYWIFDAADNSFSISGKALQQLSNALPPGSLNVTINLVSKDGEFAANYEFLAIKHSATLTGKFVNSQGQNVATLTGKKVLLKGFNSNLRKVASVDSNGTFKFDGVIPDSYLLTLNDLDNPNVVSSSTAVFATSTQVNVTIGYALDKPTSMVSIKSGRPMGVPILNSVTQNGEAPPAREVRSSAASNAGVK
jgi:hypothetical protein